MVANDSDNKGHGHSSVRLAQLSDLHKIQDLFSSGCPKHTANLRLRNEAYLHKRVSDGHAFVLPDAINPDRIRAFGEVVVLCREPEIRRFIEAELPKFAGVYRSHPGDALVYFAGFLARPDVYGWSMQAVEFVERQSFAQDFELRQAWASGDESELEHTSAVLSGRPPDAPNRKIRDSRLPRRIIWVFGSVADSCAGSLLERIGRDFLTRTTSFGESSASVRQVNGTCPTSGITHRQVVDNVPMGDGSGRIGSWTVFYFDRPLTSHQRSRTRSNRNLITETEQRRLLSTRIGIVGLSTGSVALEALLRQGVGGIYRLADFDHFELPNANRMLFGRDSVGQSKLDLCRRRIHTVDPSVVVEGWPVGVTEATVDQFVADCDIVIEECDNIAVKILVRQAARKAHIPVVMGTSQNGMLDVERYDLDRQLQPFFRTEPIDMSQWRNAPNPDSKRRALAKVVQSLFDYSQFSKRMMDSMAQMGQPNSEITSFPQLAEEVFLNAATVAHAARRILLGDNTVTTGRYSVSMDQMFGPHLRIPSEPVPPTEQTAVPSTLPPAMTSATPWNPYVKNINVQEQIQKLLFIMDWAGKAPTLGGGSDDPLPWDTRLVVQPRSGRPTIEIFLRADETPGSNKKKLLKNDLTLGSMLENAEVAAARLGACLEVEDGQHLTRIRIGKAAKSASEKAQLFPSLSVRACGVQSWKQPLPSKLVTALTQKPGVEIVDDTDRVDLVRASLNHVPPMGINKEDPTTFLALRGVSSENSHSVKEFSAAVLPRTNVPATPVTSDPTAAGSRAAGATATASKQSPRSNSFSSPSHVELGRLVRRTWLEMLHHGVGCAFLGMVNNINKEPSSVRENKFFILVPLELMPK